MSVKPEAFGRLQSYLDRLPVGRRLELLRQVALTGGREGRSRDLALVLSALRPGLDRDLRAESGEQFARAVFFRPLEPFVSEERPSTKFRGLIHGGSLDGLWKWLNFRPEWDNWSERTEAAVAAVLSSDIAAADAQVRGMRVDAAGAIHEALELANRSDLYRQKLVLRVGGTSAFADLPDIAAVFEQENDLERLAASVSARLPREGGLDQAVRQELAMLLLRERDPLDLPLMRIFRQLPDPTDLLSLLIAAEETDDGARLANSRLSGAVDILIAELDLTAIRMDRLVGDTRRFPALQRELVHFHRIARAISVGVDLDRAPVWRSALGQRRRTAAASLSAEVEATPDAIRRALRKPATPRDTALAEDHLERAVYLARLLAALVPIRAELAVNRVVVESRRRVESFLDNLETATRGGPAEEAERGRRAAAAKIRSLLDAAPPTDPETLEEVESAAEAV